MKALLIDGNSLMFRSYYATAYTGNLMKNSNGLYTNAIFGFVNMVSKLLSEPYDYVFVGFDKGKHTFRHMQYDDYKGGRKPMPDEFRVQIPYIKKYLDCLNIKHEELDEFEADDLIASVSRLSKENGIDDIEVVTGDKDLLQLVDDKIHVCLTKKGITDLDDYNNENFFSKMGFNSCQIPDYKGLAGDTSDNLPGIPGIGEKTAIKLLNEYQTLENIIENASKIKGKTGETIIQGKDSGLKCKYFATLRRDINLDFGIEEISKKEINKDELINLFQELEFKSFLKKLDENFIEEQKEETKVIELSDKYELIEEVNYDFSFLKDSYLVAEVFPYNSYNANIIGLSIISEKKRLFVCENVLLNNDSLHKYFISDYNKKTFDYKKLYVFLKRNNIEIKNVCFDLLLGAYLINPKYADDDLSKVTNNFVNSNLEEDEVIFGKGTKLAIPEINRYASNSIKKCEIIKYLEQDILDSISEYGMNDLFKAEIALSEVLGNMEINGLVVNVLKLDEIGNDLDVKAKDVQKQIYELAGEEFNINSVKQLGEILFEKLNLPSGKKNKTGYSTSSEVLEELAGNYEIAKLVLDYRAYTKIISTYVNGMKELIRDGLVHPVYKQALTQTGRLSSVEPNIQNMPVRTEIGQGIRDAFVSRFENGNIMSIDYSQIELRVLGALAKDEAMISSFKNGEDFHSATASYIFGVPVEEVTKNMRRSAKAINFGIVYGMSSWGLSNQIGITPSEAKEYITKYFEKHYKINEFFDEVKKDAKEKGYTITLFNRRRYIPELQSMNRNIYQFGERTAMNAPIQGSAADIIKFAMIKVNRALIENKYKSLLIAQVHDELVFDCYPGEEEKLMEMAKDIMENVVKLEVPLIAEASIGETWLKA